MLRLQLIMKENKITQKKLGTVANISEDALALKLKKLTDFKMSELEAIYYYLLQKEIINDDFDIGSLLDEV